MKPPVDQYDEDGEWFGTCANCNDTVRDGEVGADTKDGRPLCSRCADIFDVRVNILSDKHPLDGKR